MNWSFEWLQGELSQKLLDDWDAAAKNCNNVWANRHLVKVWGDTIGRDNDFEPIILIATRGSNILLYPLFFKHNKRLKINRYIVVAAGGWYQFSFQDPIEVAGALQPDGWGEFWAEFRAEVERKFSPLERHWQSNLA